MPSGPSSVKCQARRTRFPFRLRRPGGCATTGPMATSVPAHITGTVWKIQKRVGDSVAAGDILVILESMKMEMELESPVAGTVSEVRCKEGDAVSEGDVLMVIA